MKEQTADMMYSGMTMNTIDHQSEMSDQVSF